MSSEKDRSGNTVTRERSEVEARAVNGFVPDEETAKELATALKEAEAGDFISEREFWRAR